MDAVQANALKDCLVAACSQYSRRSWSPDAPVCLHLYVFYVTVLILLSEGNSYHGAKQSAATYQAAKRSLLGPGAPFASWVISGEEWESFDAHGDFLAVPHMI
jgi:hypothetical protein